MATLKFHPAALVFPQMKGAEWEAFKADIRANGVLEAVWFVKDKKDRKIYIDGRNRLLAARELNEKEHLDIQVPEEEYAGEPSKVIDFVESKNLAGRRHITSSQRAAIAVTNRAMRMADKTYEAPEGDWREILAASSGSNRQYVHLCNQLLENNQEELLTRICQGELSVDEAVKQWKDSVKAPKEKKDGQDEGDGEPVDANTVTDGMGNPVPERHLATFAARNLFRQFSGKMAEVKDLLDEVIDSAGSDWINQTEVLAFLANLDANVHAAAPYAVCPDCDGVGTITKKKRACKKCERHGYVTEARFKGLATATATEEAKDRHDANGHAEQVGDLVESEPHLGHDGDMDHDFDLPHEQHHHEEEVVASYE